MSADYLLLGDYNAVCYECGRKRKASTMVKHWKGYWVCPEHNEPRQPQDFVRASKDPQTVPWSQPPSDTFVAVCMPKDQTAFPDDAIPDCFMPDYISPLYYDQ